MLTDTQIKAAIRNARDDATLNDGAQGKGGGSLRLKIRVGTRGTVATWLAWWQEAGKAKTKALGTYPAMPLLEARQEAARAVQLAKNPAAVLADPQATTVGKLFAGYIAAMRQDGKRSADEVEGRLESIVDMLGEDTPAGDVTPGDIAKVLKPIHDRGSRVMADRLRAYLSAAFNWGIEATHDYRAKVRQDWGIKANPAAMVKRDTKANQARERNLATGELVALWGALDGEGFADGTGAAIKLLMCCGQRIMETMRIDGADIDLEAALWTMPAAKTKGGKRPHQVPLPPQALPILAQLIRKRGKGPLFPARTGESERQLGTSLNKAMRRWTKASGRQAFQGRDLRRTWKSRSHDAGIDRFTRDLIQQHAMGDTGSKHYDRAEYLGQKREAMAKWGAWLESNVINPPAKKDELPLAA